MLLCFHNSMELSDSLKVDYRDSLRTAHIEVPKHILSAEEIKNIKDPAALESLDSALIRMDYQYAVAEQRYNQTIDDLRQETNNNINKINGWMAAWMALLGILGIFIPIVYQYSLYRRFQSELTDEFNRTQAIIDQRTAEMALAVSASASTVETENRIICDNQHREEFIMRRLRTSITSFNQIFNIIIGRQQNSNTLQMADADNLVENLLHIYVHLIMLQNIPHIARNRELGNLKEYLRELIQNLEQNNLLHTEYVTDQINRFITRLRVFANPAPPRL